MSWKIKAAVTILLLWIAGSAFAFYWFFLGHYGLFDQDLRWQKQPLSAAQVQSQLSLQLVPDSKWQAVLITDPHCSCSSFARDHLLRLQQRQPGLVITELTVTAAQTLGLQIIAAPMLLLFQHQQLLYAGPLATDLMCSDNASLLDGIVAGSTVLPGFWLNGETTACRCLIK